MAEPETDSMVLRTVYLPVELDNALKKLAYWRGKSKGELIRIAVRDWLALPECEINQSLGQHDGNGL